MISERVRKDESAIDKDKDAKDAEVMLCPASWRNRTAAQKKADAAADRKFSRYEAAFARRRRRFN